MKILKSNEFLEKLNIGKLNIRDVKIPELRLLPDELVKKYNLVFNKITGRYDCNSDINVEADLVKYGKLITDFGVVKGNFDCRHSKLISLEGCPTKVGGKFWCQNNKLASLKGCPTEVGGGFYCYNNNLTSLEGCSTEVNGDFDCSYNKLTSLEGGPIKVGINFRCSDQKNGHKFTMNEVRALCNVKNEIHV